MAERSGGEFLARKSDVTKQRKDMPALSSVLIVEDESFDADRLKATLHVMFGYGLDVRVAKTIGAAIDAVMQRRPDIVFLDDYLKPSDNATHTIPFLRRGGYDGPLVVVSGAVDRARRNLLSKSAVLDIIHKDDVDSVRIAEAIAKLQQPPAGEPPTA